MEIRVPQRGDKAELMKTVAENARQSLTLHKSRRAGDLTTRSASLVELQEALELPDPLLRIECYDIRMCRARTWLRPWSSLRTACPRRTPTAPTALTGDAVA